MDRYVIGMDGGGTKTAVLAADMGGRILYALKAGAVNCNSESREQVARNVAGILDRVSEKFKGLDGCAGICVAAAGVGNPAAADLLRTSVGKRYKGPLFLEGDHVAALYGATGKPCGIVIVSGTGSICYGKDESGREHRTGGFGHLIDDGGSGYAIGRDILSAVVQAYDGRSGRTLLTDLVFEKLGISSIPELMEFLYSGSTGKSEVAALAPLLDVACGSRDGAALQIVERSSDALFHLLVPVIERLHFQSPEIAFAGSILLKSHDIRDSLRGKIASSYPKAKCCDQKHGAAYGAVLIALERLRILEESGKGKNPL